MRQRGFDTVQMIVFVVILGLLGAGVVFARHWWESTKAELRAEGANGERLKWQAREREQQQEYADELRRLRAERDAELGALQDDLAAAAAGYEKKRKEHDLEKAKNARLERGLRAGSLVLHDSGSPAPGSKACGGEGPADPAAAGRGAGEGEPGGSGLSSELSAFLWSEAGRADAVISDLVERLTFAQDTVVAYYRLSVRCHAQEGTP